MDNTIKNLEENLGKGQELKNGYIVNNVESSISLLSKIKIEQKFQPVERRNFASNQLIIKDTSQTLNPAEFMQRIKVIEQRGNHPHSKFQIDTFNERSRINLSLQNRLGEKMDNQLATNYAPRATNFNELQALNSTRPILTDKLKSLNEYIKTHSLSEKEKLKLRDDIIKENYQEWLKTVKGVEEKQKPAVSGAGETKEDDKEPPVKEFVRERAEVPKDTDKLIFRRTDLETNPELKQEIDQNGAWLNYNITINKSLVERIAKEYFKINGEYYNSIFNITNPNKKKSINAILSLFRRTLSGNIVITRDAKFDITRKLNNLTKKILWFNNIVQIINQIVQDKLGQQLILLTNINLLNTRNKTNQEQTKKYIELFYFISQIFHNELMKNRRLNNGLQFRGKDPNRQEFEVIDANKYIENLRNQTPAGGQAVGEEIDLE